MRTTEADAQRRQANMVRIGTIEEADYAKGRYRVKIGNIVTAWLPFGGQRAGALKVWSPLTVGEQIVMVSPSGDLTQGVIMGSIASDAHPSPGNDGGTINIEFPDGSTLDFGGGELNFNSPAAVTVTAPQIKFVGEITIEGAVNQSGGDITAETDVIGGGISLKTHVHGGVQSGGSNTAPPV